MLTKKKKVTKQEYKRLADLRSACSAAKSASQVVRAVVSFDVVTKSKKVKISEERQKASVWLREKFPKIFVSKKPRALKIGILEDIINAGFSDMPAFAALKRAIGLYVQSTAYLKAMKTDEKRRALDSKHVGFVTTEQAEIAAKKLALKLAERAKQANAKSNAADTEISIVRTSTRPILSLKK